MVWVSGDNQDTPLQLVAIYANNSPNSRLHYKSIVKEFEPLFALL